MDVKTAFLQVPGGRSKDMVVVNPPTIFQENQIRSGELWAVEGSVYGVTTSPRDCANHRDEVTWACWFENTSK